jgi:hypothetical protein
MFPEESSGKKQPFCAEDRFRLKMANPRIPAEFFRNIFIFSNEEPGSRHGSRLGYGLWSANQPGRQPDSFIFSCNAVPFSGKAIKMFCASGA